MLLHITRAETTSFFGYRSYQFTARIEVTPDERRLVEQHALGETLLFVDPYRQVLQDESDVAHENAKSIGAFVTTASDASAICGQELHALVLALRAHYAFDIDVADLLSDDGVVVTHASLQAIRDIEKVLIDCVDRIDGSIKAASGYSNATEDLYIPGNDDPGIPPSRWLKPWRG